MKNDLRIKIKIDSDTKELVFTKNEVGKLNNALGKTSNSSSSLLSEFKKLGIVAGIFYGIQKSVSALIKTGLKYNNLIVNQRNSLATLINATSKNVDSMGRNLTYQEKMNLALANSNQLMAELTRINAKTPQTLGQTAQIFKTMYAPMQKVGATQEDLIFLTEKLAIASKVGGVEFNSLLAGVDGLASGTVLANSNLGRFLSSLGLTNEALKSTDDVVGLLKEKLKDFKAFDDLDTSVSNLNVQWDTLTGNLTKDLYSKQKVWVKSLTAYLQSLNEELKDYQDNIYRVSDIYKLKASSDLKREIQQLKDKKEALENISVYMKYLKYGSDSAYKGEIKYNDFLIKQAQKRLKLLKEAKNIDSSKGPHLVSNSSSGDIEDVKIMVDKNRYSYLEDAKNWELTQEEKRKSYDDFVKSLVEADKKRVASAKQTQDEINAYLTSSQTTQEKMGYEYLHIIKLADGDIDKIKEIDEAYFKKLEKEQEKTVKDFQKIKIDFSSAISTAIIDGINGSNLQSSMSKFGTSVSNQMITKGVSGAMATSGFTALAMSNPYTAIGLGIGGSYVSSLLGNLGSGKSEAQREQERQAKILNDVNSEFNEFKNALNKTSDVLKSFGSEGTADITSLNARASKYREYAGKVAPYTYVYPDFTVKGRDSNKLAQRLTANEARELLSYYGLNIPALRDYDYSSRESIIDQKAKTFTELDMSTLNDTSVHDLIKNEHLYLKYKDEYESNINEILSKTLDYSTFTKSELENLVGDFDQASYDDTLKQINDLSLKAKEAGGVLDDEDQQKLMDLYSLPNFIKGQDYKGAIDTLNDMKQAEKDLADERKRSYEDLISTLRGISETYSVIGMSSYETALAKINDAKTDLLASPTDKDVVDRYKDAYNQFVSSASSYVYDTQFNSLEDKKFALATVNQQIAGYQDTALDTIGYLEQIMINTYDTASNTTNLEGVTHIEDSSREYVVATSTSGETVTTARLYGSGGFTGKGQGRADSSGYKPAGIVHEDEWVAPKWMINSNQELFSNLENIRERGSFANGGFTSPVSLNLSSNNSNDELGKRIDKTNAYMFVLANELKQQNRLLKRVTNNGEAMLTEVA